MYYLYRMFQNVCQLIKNEIWPGPKCRKKYTCFLGTFETQLIWANIIGITILHVAAVVVIVTYPYTTRFPLLIWAFLVGNLGGLGVTAGAHRLYTHRAYKAKPILQIILLFAFAIAGQNQMRDWVRDHRIHHKFSETDADPHNSKRGFFFAHVGWLMMRKHEKVLEKGKVIDLSDMDTDPIVVFFDKHFWFFKLFSCFIFPVIIPYLVWNEDLLLSFWTLSVARYAISLNSTWLVNSAAHLWGNRPYDKTIQPVENLFVSLFALGEGWHNYHHTFPWDYRTSEFGRFNPTQIFLDIMAGLGLAYDLKTPSQELVKKVIQKTGDGTHWMSGVEIFELNDKVL